MDLCETEDSSKIEISNGVFLTLKRGDDFYLVQGGKRHHLPYAAWTNLFEKEEIIRIKTMSELESIPLGTPMSADTCLIKSKKADPVYLCSNGIKRHIRNPKDFELAGFSWNKIDNKLVQNAINKYRDARDFVIAKNKEITLIPGDIPYISPCICCCLNYGYIKSFKYKGHDGTEKECKILFPKGCLRKKLPVLYLFHGLGSNDEWTDNTKGRIRKIMRYMTSENLIPDMAIVMPSIFPSDLGAGDVEKKVAYFHNFNKDLPHLMEYVNTNFSEKISTCKEDTAIAGISIGGSTALYNGCLYKDRFNYVGGISASYHLIKCDNFTNGWLKSEDFKLGTEEGGFAYITVGKEDHINGISSFNKKYSVILNENGIDHIFGYLPGGSHNWDTFRNLFYHFMSYDFFRKKAE